MSPTSSPQRDVTELLSRRRSANIPSDQKSLLEGHDSWAVDLRNQPHGLVHIPGHILEAAKAVHLAQKKKPQAKTPRSKKRSASPVAPASSKRMRNGTTSITKLDSEKPPQSSPEKPIPWTPSPPRNHPREADSIHVAIDTTAQSLTVQETPKTGPARPRPLQRASIPPFPDPPVSDESEDDMETRIPDAQPLIDAPINRTAVRTNAVVPSPQSTAKSIATPPCAQPSNLTQSSSNPTQSLVPETVIPSKTAPEHNRNLAKGKGRLVFKPIEVDDGDRRKKKGYLERERLAPTTIPPAFHSSVPGSSDSCIPNTYDVPGTQESIRESIEGKEDEEARLNGVEETIPSTDHREPVAERTPSRKPVSVSKPKSLPETKRAANQNPPPIQQVQPQQAQQQPVQPTTPIRMGPPKGIASVNSHKRSTNNEVVGKSQSPIPSSIAPGASREPFDTFVQHYPAYASGDGGRVAAGTKLHFITACVYLNYLRSRHLLRDSMYDEFIRAFPRYYKEYVDETRRPALVAIKWFNKQKGPLLFNKYLVHRGNLSHIIRSYPNEFIEVNEKILKKKDGDELSIYTSSEDEGELSEESDPPSPVRRRSTKDHVSSPVSRRSDKKTAEVEEPVASLESDMDMNLSEILPAHASRSVRNSSVVAVKEKERHVRSDSTSSSVRNSSVAAVKEKEHHVRSDSASRSEQRPAPPSTSKARRTTMQVQPDSSRAQDIITQAPPPSSPKIPESSMLPPSSAPNSSARWKAPRPSQYLEKLSTRNRASLGSSMGSTPTAQEERRRAKLREHFRKSIAAQKAKTGTNAQGVRSSGRAER
ncbi:hypothetical protein FLONG3_1472 [Fusarium longipes]|uniref:Uncharacterized protein n=1 Tax=Fusarium longipes TaxID=694270 RepID=A0A395T6F8_9HYPO|nr:hypothetical protein FLONG3_1472 [Fusarium longipes]